MPSPSNAFKSPQTVKSGAVLHSAQQSTWPPTVTPGQSSLLATAGANGARFTRVGALPHESTGAFFVAQLYRDLGTGGASKYLVAAIAGTNDTVSATDAPIALDFGFSEDNPLFLQANERLYVAHSLNNKVVGFYAEWGDY